MSELTPVTFAPKCKTPAFFIHANEDELVLKNNSERNFAVYGCEVKIAEYCSGGHNDERPAEMIKRVIEFLKSHLLA